jgi:TIR domain
MSRYRSCFITYSTPDERIVRRINAFLSEKGVRTWAWFEQGKLGEWRPQIQSALDEHECILLIMSRAAIASRGVQDENRLALVDDLRPYTSRLLPILLESLASIQEAITGPSERELLNLVRRVTCVDLHSANGRLTNAIQSRLLFLLQRPVMKVMVMGSVSQESEAENDLKRPFIHALARSIGKYIALDHTKSICITTRGGGIDPYVCEGFQNSSTKDDVEGRLWVYPEPRKVIAYAGDGREVRLPFLSSSDSGKIITDMTRVKLIISRMAIEADSVIAIRGGRGVEHAAIMALAQGKRIVVAPGLGGAGEELYRIHQGVPGLIAPEGCESGPTSWDPQSEEVDRFAELLVNAALRG